MKGYQNQGYHRKPGTVIVKGVHLGPTEVMTDKQKEKKNEADAPRTILFSQREIERRIARNTEQTGAGFPNASPVAPQNWPQGWLVAIEGPMKGQTFPISYGYNHIGRAESNRICLSNDPGISSVQCVVHYNSDKRIFYIEKSAQSSQETRLSDGSLVGGSMVPLEAGEIIRLSPHTQLRFMPFCGDYFNWDYEN